MSWADEENERRAARLRRDAEWDEEYRAPAAPQWPDEQWPAPAGFGPLPPPPYPAALAAIPPESAPWRPAPPPARAGRDPEELLREAYDPDALTRQLEASYIPERGITTPEREAARRAGARRLRREGYAADYGRAGAYAATRARLDEIERRDMEQALARTEQAMARLGIGAVGHEPGFAP